MPAYCDISPCEGMLPALGRYVFGDLKTGEYKLLTAGADKKRRAVSISYCPFCGTRLDNLQLASTGTVIMVEEPNS